MSTLVVLALIGLILGSGGYFVWHTFLAEPALGDKPTKLITQASTSGSKVSAPAQTRSTPDEIPVAVGTSTNDVRLDELTIQTDDKPIGRTTSDGLAVRPKELKLDSRKPSWNDAYEVVQKIDKQVSVVRDPRTRLLGLRKTNGAWVGEREYNRIGKFENGIAPAQTQKGQETYLSKSGHRYDDAKAASNGKTAVRKGNRWGYLNMNGDLSIALRYDKAESFKNDDTAEVTLRGKPIRIDKQGNPKNSNDEEKLTEAKKG